MPRSFARLFIFATNSSSFPQIYSAIDTQASFALATEIHLISVSTVCVSPGSRNTCEPPMDAAYSDVVTSSASLIWPLSSASNINSNVITFVTLAGGNFSSGFFSYMICPVDASIRIADGALICSCCLFSFSVLFSCEFSG